VTNLVSNTLQTITTCRSVSGKDSKGFFYDAEGRLGDEDEEEEGDFDLESQMLVDLQGSPRKETTKPVVQSVVE
jgi:hypothetical protein